MEAYAICKDLAIILLAAKLFAMLARKIKMPQVAGEIIAGLLIGPLALGLVQQTDFIAQMAEIGVIMIMFSAGLTTDLNELIKTGPVAFLIACAGVFVPLVGGTVLYMAFYGFAPWGDEAFVKALFIGTIMTATSVSITVEALRELGKLQGKVGTTILSAAIIDDIIGIVVLTIVMGFKDPTSSISKTLIQTGLFLLLSAVLGIVLYKVFKLLDEQYPHTRRMPIFGLVLCFAMAYVAERYFGIADITGAYVAGIILCNLHDSNYIARKMDINSYMVFGPIFFVSIGLKTSFDGVDISMLLFCVLFVVVALVTKIIGCGLMSRACGFHGHDCLKIGVGMMTRGEVALVVAQKGLSAGLLDSSYFAPVILLIICSSIATPIILKVLFAKDAPEAELEAKAEKAQIS